MVERKVQKKLTTEEWIMANADKFEMDCRPDRRDDTGIETPDYIRQEIDRRRAAQKKKPDSA